MSRKKIDLTNMRFGKLLVIGPYDPEADGPVNFKTNGYALWTCFCDCGGVVVAGSHQLRHGYIISCGCERRPGLRGQK